ncbi:MAG: pyridoxamine 5'-phosphate oxidase family protein [Geodermatophilaceae bacterium]|nr:pyridoxamine 5'-phosphate oxidase family protein [Geodermatophilaceae bacterium]
MPGEHVLGRGYAVPRPRWWEDLVRTTDDGELMSAARRQLTAVLEVDDLVNWSRSGWSVLIRGRLSEETDAVLVQRVLGSGLRPWALGPREHVVRMSGDEVTGRRIEPGQGGVIFYPGAAPAD